MLEQSQDINAQMPAYVGARISDALNATGRPVKGTRVLILGVAYKAGVGDVRESPALKVLEWLARRGADVAWHDPYVETVTLNGLPVDRIDLNSQSLREAGCVALLTPHEGYDLNWIAHESALVFDARNAYGDDLYTNVVRL
jgi:UDP-N-acetyl-D-glucosamine dehydrogenase